MTLIYILQLNRVFYSVCGYTSFSFIRIPQMQINTVMILKYYCFSLIFLENLQKRKGISTSMIYSSIIQIHQFSMLQIPGIAPKIGNNQAKSTGSRDPTGLNRSVLQNYKKYVFGRESFKSYTTTNEKQEDFSDDLLEWASKNGVDHASFLCFPYNSTMCEKQESLIDLKYFYLNGIRAETRLLLNKEYLAKGETDGSSFPSGGLRFTHRARAYMIRDPLSDIFIRRKNKIMYIPSLLVTHHGMALDDKTIFRKTESVMKTAALNLLKSLGKNAKEIFLALGLQQQFFVIPKSAYHKRQDLIFTGRTLVGRVGAKNQQFADHYFAKIPHQIQGVLREIQNEFLEIGIPFKTRHNEVANNQFQYASIFTEAGKAIDQNLIAMEILKELFQKKGYIALLHEKPFLELNGSGKHANWSINYVDQQNKIKNLFSVPKDPADVPFFRLFVLLTLNAIKRNNPLYFAAIARAGNQIRLGGHQAPPRIISAYLGQTVSAVVDGKPIPQRKNLKKELFFLYDDIYQQDTDRNRTSPFAYTGHKFEFRALGSSQNAAWPMAVICATIAKEFIDAEKKIKQGYTIDTLIQELLKETQSVRFEGDGYSKAWSTQAKKRGLYVNESFKELFDRLPNQVGVFTEIGACSKEEILAKCQVMREDYRNTIETEARALINLAYQKIIPRGVKYLQILKSNLSTEKPNIQTYYQRFAQAVDSGLAAIQDLQKSVQKCDSYSQAAEVRRKVIEIGQSLGQLCGYLQKDDHFPDIEDFLLK